MSLLGEPRGREQLKMSTSKERSVVKTLGFKSNKDGVKVAGLVHLGYKAAVAAIAAGNKYLFERPRKHRDGEASNAAGEAPNAVGEASNAVGDFILSSTPKLSLFKASLPKKSAAAIDDNYQYVGQVDAEAFSRLTHIKPRLTKKDMTEVQRAKYESTAVVSHTESTLTHEYIEDVLIPKIVGAFVSLPYIKGAIEKMVENAVQQRKLDGASAKEIKEFVDSGKPKNDAITYFGEQALECIRSYLIEICVKVRDRDVEITAKNQHFKAPKQVPTSNGTFRPATTADILDAFTEWRRMNGFNHKLVVVEEEGEKRQDTRYEAVHYAKWAKHQYEHWAHGIPIDGYQTISVMAPSALNDGLEGSYFRQQEKSETNAARNILRTGERAMEERIRVAYNAHKNGERAPRLE